MLTNSIPLPATMPRTLSLFLGDYCFPFEKRQDLHHHLSYHCQNYMTHCTVNPHPFSIALQLEQCELKLSLREMPTHHTQEHSHDPVSIVAKRDAVNELYNTHCDLCDRIFISVLGFEQHSRRGVSEILPRTPSHELYREALLAKLVQDLTTKDTNSYVLRPYSQILSPQQYAITPYSPTYVVLCKVCKQDFASIAVMQQHYTKNSPCTNVRLKII